MCSLSIKDKKDGGAIITDGFSVSVNSIKARFGEQEMKKLDHIKWKSLNSGHYSCDTGEKARRRRCCHQFICCHVCSVETGSRDGRCLEAEHPGMALFCLLHNWLSLIMMQGYWLSHKELSKQKSRETEASRFYFLFEKQQQTNDLNFSL